MIISLQKVSEQVTMTQFQGSSGTYEIYRKLSFIGVSLVIWEMMSQECLFFFTLSVVISHFKKFLHSLPFSCYYE